MSTAVGAHFRHQCTNGPTRPETEHRDRKRIHDSFGDRIYTAQVRLGRPRAFISVFITVCRLVQLTGLEGGCICPRASTSLCRYACLTMAHPPPRVCVYACKRGSTCVLDCLRLRVYEKGFQVFCLARNANQVSRLPRKYASLVSRAELKAYRCCGHAPPIFRSSISTTCICRFDFLSLV